MKKKIIEELPGLLSQAAREVGLEIEMEGVGIQVRVPGWKRMEDGSLRGESAEYILSKPVPAKDVPKMLTRLEKAFKEANSRLEPSDRCGVHVHINCQQMSVEQVVNFCVLYLVVEDLLVRWCGEDREGNLFCLRAKDAEWLVQCLITAVQKGNIQHLTMADIRYASINLTSLSKYGSVEFRAMRTPEKFDKINTWVEMLMAIKNASLRYKEARAIIEDVSLKEPKQFLSDIFGENVKEIWSRDALDMVMQGVRRVQEVAFAHVFIPPKPKGLDVFPDRYWIVLFELWNWCKDRTDGALVSYVPNDGRGRFTHTFTQRGRIETAHNEWGDIAELADVDLSEVDMSHQTDYEFVRDKYEEVRARQRVERAVQFPRPNRQEVNYIQIGAGQINWDLVEPLAPPPPNAPPQPEWRYINYGGRAGVNPIPAGGMQPAEPLDAIWNEEPNEEPE